MLEQVFGYIEGERGRMVEELKGFLRWASVSAQGAHGEDVRGCAGWLRDHLAGLGLAAELVETAGQPIVRAQGGKTGGKRVIVYGHYDVQPEDPRGEWLTEPFEPVERAGYLYGRGTTDDKGQLWAHVKGVEAVLRQAGELGVEVVFLVEGEEECGGSGLEDYVVANAGALREGLVGCVVSDTSMYGPGRPAVTYGLRGTAGLEVRVHGPGRDLHSGQYGGAVGNPVQALAWMLGECVGRDGVVEVPGFYEGVGEMAMWERENIERLGYDEAALAAEAGVAALWGEQGRGALERMWARPTFEVNGIYGGYTGEGGKTIIPSSATAKLSMRLVPGQAWRQVVEATVSHLERLCPEFARLEVLDSGGADPVLMDVDSELMRAGLRALEAGFGVEPELIRCGGSIPVVSVLERELGAPVLLMGLGLDSDGAHSPNERFAVEHMVKGAKASAALLMQLGESQA